MKRLFVFTIICIILAFSIMSCGSTTTAPTTANTAAPVKTATAVPTTTPAVTAAPTTAAPAPATRIVTDIAGRTVTVPVQINRVVCLHPIPDYLVWRLAPQKLVSISRVFNLNLKAGTMKFPDDEIAALQKLPIVPVYFDALDPEQILALKPDVIVDMTKDPNLDKLQATLGIPIVAISKDTLNDYEASFRFMGELLGNQQEANDLADSWHSFIARITGDVAKIPGSGQLKVYYASHDGPLSTVGAATVMASIINLAGGIDYATAHQDAAIQATDEHATVSLEEVLLWNPDVIITKTATERNTIMSSPDWADTAAVKNNRVYCCLRYEAMDGLMSLISLGWAAKQLYPDQITFDIVKESQDFYVKFYRNSNMTETQILQEQNDKY